MNRSDKPLSIARTVLGALTKLNIVFGIFIFALLVASVVAADPVMRALGVRSVTDNGGLILSMRGIMIIGILGTPVVHLIYTRLRAIVETVNSGDPFVVENAARLETIAWAIAGLELMRIAVVMLANGVWVGAQTVDIKWEFPLTQVLTILLLFVLARVFDHGARMRDELAATV